MAAVKKRVEASKELETLSIRAFLCRSSDVFAGKTVDNDKMNAVTWILNNKISPESKRNSEDNTHFLIFQRAMKFLLFAGQCLGLNPVTGILETDITKVRYRFLTWKVLYSLVIGAAQALATALTAYRLLSHTITIQAVAFFAFYLCATCTTFNFQRIATKWPSLMKELYNSRLNKYVDPAIKFKCYLACFIILFLSLLEHGLSHVSRLAEIVDCTPKTDIDVYKQYLESFFPWIFDLYDSFYLPIGVTLQIVNLISTMNWNYSDLLIICMSMYLTSILNCINKKIESAHENIYQPPSFWRCLREDYNRATRLVRSFDSVISSVVFISFANNLFFICLQLYYCLAKGVRFIRHNITEECPNYPSGPFGGSEALVYWIVSLCYLLGRSLTVSLLAASVHSASLAPAPTLYNIAPSMYCSEVQRFIDQVHGDTIALSGLQFFYVTRELVLSVAGTIVTYELVLLQFSNED